MIDLGAMIVMGGASVNHGSVLWDHGVVQGEGRRLPVHAQAVENEAKQYHGILQPVPSAADDKTALVREVFFKTAQHRLLEAPFNTAIQTC